MEAPPVFFTFKRFALYAGRWARALCTMVDNTPQRTDLMLAVRGGELAQKVIAFELGVTPAVVSRMVDALVARGFVKRRIPSEDRRLRLVSLTPKGEQSLARLFRECEGAQEAGCQIQFGAEGAFMSEWKRVFEDANVSTKLLAYDDRAGVLARVHSTVARTIYYGDPRWNDRSNPYRYDDTQPRVA
jgi:DNA-binding MarR family transcriptional regulator